jgi:dephospho-CoA kinase
MGLIIGLTGGIGSGKTAASDWFAAQGIDIVDADVVARLIVQPGQPVRTRLGEAAGDGQSLRKIRGARRIFIRPR